MQLQSPAQTARRNPNATVAFLSAAPGAQLVLAVSSYFNWTISTGLAIYISGGLAYVALLVGRAGAAFGRDGVRGCWRRLMDGNQPQGG